MMRRGRNQWEAQLQGLERRLEVRTKERDEARADVVRLRGEVETLTAAADQVEHVVVDVHGQVLGRSSTPGPAITAARNAFHTPPHTHTIVLSSEGVTWSSRAAGYVRRPGGQLWPRV
jgi:multidrug resistance efflux pump